MPKLKICISGRDFLVSLASIENSNPFNKGLLSKDSDYYDEEMKCLFFERNPDLFPMVLEYIRTGEVHLFGNFCGQVVQQELKFWGISEREIRICCWDRFRENDDKLTCFNVVKNALSWSQKLHEGSLLDGPREETRRKIRIFLQDPFSSVTAKLWASFMFMAICASVAIVCMETDEFFRSPALLTVPKINSNETNPKYKMYDTTDARLEIMIIDIALNAVFTVELLLWYMTFVNLRDCLMSFMTYVDFISISGTWMQYIIIFSYPRFRFVDDSIYFLFHLIDIMRLIRVFRLLKLAAFFKEFHVLLLTLKASVKELLLLCTLIFTWMTIFAVLIYIAELTEPNNFHSILKGFWWSVVTMTTVGYGDTHPESAPGYIVGCFCALCGLLCTGLPIPIIGNRFNQYYNSAQLVESLAQRSPNNVENSLNNADDNVEADDNTLVVNDNVHTADNVDTNDERDKTDIEGKEHDSNNNIIDIPKGPVFGDTSRIQVEHMCGVTSIENRNLYAESPICGNEDPGSLAVADNEEFNIAYTSITYTNLGYT
ncbi:unnamed protein product [Owenia fusiformis]|uniref:Uncharacterized protein n=1 Tax=Owenia fusiformis TaxID=6347 RepID=A0A8J1XG66_OWEFU|nr:unnamed protein product [Owenia fusiformis]